MKNFIKNTITNALQKAVSANSVTWTKFFLFLGGDSNALNKDGQAPLHLATAKGHFALASLLLKKGANPDLFNLYRQAPLHMAALGGQAALTSLLLEKGANPDILNKHGQTPLHLVINSPAPYEKHKSTLEVLLQKAKIDAQDHQNQTPFHYAIKQGNLEIIERLLKEKGDFNLADRTGKTPLHLAIEKNNRPIITTLLKQNIDPNLPDSNGNTPLHLAVRLRGTLLTTLEAERLDLIIQDLLDHQANPNAYNHNQETPLHIAAHSNNSESVKVLLAAGAQPNMQDKNGSTPLHIAVNYKNSYSYQYAQMDVTKRKAVLAEHHTLIETLCKRGANPNLYNNQSETPLHIAASLKDSKALEHLLNHKAELNLLDQQQRSALHRTVTPKYSGIIYYDPQEQQDTEETINLLLAKGGNPYQKDLNGITPLQIAKTLNSCNKSYISLLTETPQPKNLPDASIQPNFTQRISKFPCASMPSF